MFSTFQIFNNIFIKDDSVCILFHDPLVSLLRTYIQIHDVLSPQLLRAPTAQGTSVII
jgi:hypothetical protein